MFGFGMFHENPGPARPFNSTYRCYSVSMVPGPERSEVEDGGKIILPPSALAHLTRLNVVYPMLFKITNPVTSRVTHCGVLEFVADEGRCYIPYWMMRNLMIDEGAIIQIETATLPVASFSKFQPQSREFLDISNPKALLENALRSFACLTSGDLIAIRYNNKIYELRVLETRPGPAVSIIECDMDVDFAKPVDYIEPLRKNEAEETAMDQENEGVEPSTLPTPFTGSGLVPFTGSGNRLDGKESGNGLPLGLVNGGKRPVIPDYKWSQGGSVLEFYRGHLPLQNGFQKQEEFKPFAGEGASLKTKPRKD